MAAIHRYIWYSSVSDDSNKNGNSWLINDEPDVGIAEESKKEKNVQKSILPKNSSKLNHGVGLVDSGVVLAENYS